MHELSLAQGIMEAALGEAEKAGSKRISRIRVSVKSDHSREDASLQFLLEAVAKGTIADGALITTEIIPPTLKCKDCGFQFVMAGTPLACPRCQGARLEEIDADKVELECDFGERS